MNTVLICNMAFYLSPYVVMMTYDLRDRIPSKLKKFVSNVGMVFLISTFIYSVISLIHYGYTKNGGYVTFGGFIPTYLLTFYVLSVLISVLACYMTSYSLYESLHLGFLISYVTSFYWEVPENIFWQIKRGYHPAILLAMLGAFPYIWLNKKIGWEKNRKNMSLILFGWATTTLGVLTLKSNVYTTPTGGLYFLGCRAVCLLILVKIFVLKDIVEINPIRLLLYSMWALRYAVKGNWRLGTEIAYWDYEINHNRPEGWCLPSIAKYLYKGLDLIEKEFDINGRDIKVLELGPGPRSRLTEDYDKGRFDLVAVDPLADEFKKHLDGRDFLYQGYAETMNNAFPPESFHLSYASNSLDHTQDIQQSFQNMVDLTKVGGMIIVQGNIREGERLNWMGIHKYSIWIEDGDIIYITKDGYQFNLTENVGLTLVAHREAIKKNNQWYSIMYRKVKSSSM